MNSEFQFIRHIKDRYSLKYAGDDCAVLPKDENSDLLFTADLLIEDVDFRLEWAKPADLGHKSLAVSLSDVAAMGGTPQFAALSLGVPRSLWNDNFLEGFYAGWTALAKEYGVELVGGDISSSDKFVIDSIVLAETPRNKAILRFGAKPGDAIFVSGSLGGAAAGLKLLDGPEKDTKWDENAANLVTKQLRPTPQVDLGKRLMNLGLVTSMIDISDGLSSDLTHICEASGVGAVVDALSLPVHSDIHHCFPNPNAPMEFALNGGEDFELLFTIPEKEINRLVGFPVHKIGTINDSLKVELYLNDNVQDLLPKGFQHFE